MVIKFQNENLVASVIKDGKEPEYVASVPDLICTVDNERYEPVLTEDLKFGIRLSVLVVPSVPEMMTETAMKVVGPACFRYPDVVFKPIGGSKVQTSEIMNPTV